MKKIFLIIQREYLTRVKKKAFIIMTVLGPILLASIFIAPLLISKASEEKVVIEVIDELGITLQNTDNIQFVYRDISFNDAKENFRHENYYAVLYIRMLALNLSDGGVLLYSDKDVSITIKRYLASTIENELFNAKLTANGIDRDLLKSLKTKINIKTIMATTQGEQAANTELKTTVGFIGGFLIYFFIFLYGAQVMRGVIEEKTSRIVEVIISSVKPFQLMMGKIVGVALVGLTQFVLWVILTFGITTVVTSVFLKNKSDSRQLEKMMLKQSSPLAEQQEQDISDDAASSQLTSKEISRMFGMINLPAILTLFLFYFLGGYLLYASLFAAIGAAVDSETDTQQFMLPITIPLILAFIVAQSVVVNNPNSSLAFWFSIIPFTSPVVMMVRIPFGIPVHQIILSAGLLVAGFIFTTWMAGRIYRVGILMYGKKVNYKELWKWLFYTQ